MILSCLWLNHITTVMCCHSVSISLRNIHDSVVYWFRLLLLMYFFTAEKEVKQQRTFESIVSVSCIIFRSLLSTDNAIWHSCGSITQKSTVTLWICIKNLKDFGDARHVCLWRRATRVNRKAACRLGMWIGEQGQEIYKTFSWEEGERNDPFNNSQIHSQLYKVEEE